MAISEPDGELSSDTESGHLILDLFSRTVRSKFLFLISVCSVQFSSVTQLCPTLCDPMDRSMPGLPVHHQFPESTQIHVHRVGDAT